MDYSCSRGAVVGGASSCVTYTQLFFRVEEVCRCNDARAIQTGMKSAKWFTWRERNVVPNMYSATQIRNCVFVF